MAARKKVKELMVPIEEYPVIYDTDSLKDAIQELKKYLAKEKGHRSLLVFKKTNEINNKDHLVGVLTIRDILNSIKQNTLSYDRTELFKVSWTRFYHADPMKKISTNQVRDVIRPLVQAFIHVDQDVADAIRLMLTKNVNLLPVFEGNKAVGIIRAIDLLDYIGEMV